MKNKELKPEKEDEPSEEQGMLTGESLVDFDEVFSEVFTLMGINDKDPHELEES